MSLQSWTTNFNDGSPKNLSCLYIKRLYTNVVDEEFINEKRCNQSMHPNVIRLFESVSGEKLEIERNARINNLRAFLTRGCKHLFDMMSKQEAYSNVKNFCDSEDFWIDHGRSLSENFCVWFCKQFTDNKKLLIAEVAKLDGVVSGILHNPSNYSPWPNHQFQNSSQLKEKNIIAIEYFDSPFAIMNQSGKVDPQQNMVGLYRITIWVTQDKTVKFKSEKMKYDI